jgi:heptosyltransferase III
LAGHRPGRMDEIPKKILIIQLRRIGDAVFTLPAIGALRRAFPSAQIDFLVEAPADELVRMNPHLNQTLVYDKNRALYWIGKIRSRRYDAVLDFHANGRTLWLTFFSGARIRAGFDGPLSRKLAYNRRVRPKSDQFIVEQKLDLVRALTDKTSSDDWSWDLKLPADDLNEAAEALKKGGSTNRIIGFAPAHRHPIRAWSPEQFIETGKKLAEKDFRILLLGGPGEKDFLNGIARGIGKSAMVKEASSVLELAAWIAQCQAFLANDNGPQKIAMALGVPSLTIFGPTNPKTINPNRSPHFALRDETLFCIGCERKTCPYQHECMRNIAPDQVFQKLTSLLVH